MGSLWLPLKLGELLYPTPGFFWRNCCERNCCGLLADDFNRASLGSDWNAVAGSFDLDSNELRTTSSNAVLIASPTHTDAAVRVVVKVLGTTNGDTGRVLLDYADANNYHFAQLTIGSSPSLSLYRRSAGSNSLLATATPSAAAVNQWHTLDVCISQAGTFGARFDGHGGNSTTVAIGLSSASNGSFGLGSGTVVGTVRFDDFHATIIGEDCDACAPVSCGFCEEGFGPLEYQAEVSGIAYQATGWSTSCVSPTVDNCDDLNGTFILRRTQNDDGFGGCTWLATTTLPHPCAAVPASTPGRWGMKITEFSGTRRIEVYFARNLITTSFRQDFVGEDGATCQFVEKVIDDPETNFAGCTPAAGQVLLTAL